MNAFGSPPCCAQTQQTAISASFRPSLAQRHSQHDLDWKSCPAGGQSKRIPASAGGESRAAQSSPRPAAWQRGGRPGATMVRHGTQAALARLERGRQQERAAEALRSEVAAHRSLKARGQVRQRAGAPVQGAARAGRLTPHTSPPARLRRSGRTALQPSKSSSRSSERRQRWRPHGRRRPRRSASASRRGWRRSNRCGGGRWPGGGPVWAQKLPCVFV